MSATTTTTLTCDTCELSNTTWKGSADDARDVLATQGWLSQSGKDECPVCLQKRAEAAEVWRREQIEHTFRCSADGCGHQTVVSKFAGGYEARVYMLGAGRWTLKNGEKLLCPACSADRIRALGL